MSIAIPVSSCIAELNSIRRCLARYLTPYVGSDSPSLVDPIHDAFYTVYSRKGSGQAFLAEPIHYYRICALSKVCKLRNLPSAMCLRSR